MRREGLFDAQQARLIGRAVGILLVAQWAGFAVTRLVLSAGLLVRAVPVFIGPDLPPTDSGAYLLRQAAGTAQNAILPLVIPLTFLFVGMRLLVGGSRLTSALVKRA